MTEHMIVNVGDYQAKAVRAESLNPILQKLDIVVGVRKVLDREEHWTKGVLARQSLCYGDDELSVTDPKATAFCMLGAAYRALGIDSCSVSGMVAEALGFSDATAVTRFNDGSSTTFKDVADYLERREVELRTAIGLA